jgi:hypothetical protein
MNGDPVAWTLIEPGWNVVAADGSDVGRVDEVVGDENVDIFNGLKILTGRLGSPKYVPSEQVGEIVEGRVGLQLTKEEIDRLGDYDEPPRSTEFTP